MNQRIINGLLITKPTREDIESIRVGNVAPDVFGRMAMATRIFAYGTNIKERAYVCYYTEFGKGQISHSMTEGEYVATIPLTAKYFRVENYPII